MNRVKAKNRIVFVASAFGLVLIGLGFLSCSNTDGGKDPTLVIVAPAKGATVSNPVLLKVKYTNFTEPGGHVHVWVDKTDTTDATTDTIFYIPADSGYLSKTLAPGAHYVRVQGAHQDHSDIDGMYDSTSFTVSAP